MQLIDFYKKREAKKKFTDADIFRLVQNMLFNAESSYSDSVITPSLAGRVASQIIFDDITQSNAVPNGYPYSVDTWRNSVW